MINCNNVHVNWPEQHIIKIRFYMFNNNIKLNVKKKSLGNVF